MRGNLYLTKTEISDNTVIMVKKDVKDNWSVYLRRLGLAGQF